MGSDLARILSFSSLGHQSRFDVPPPAVCVNGHFASVDICSLLWSVGRRPSPTCRRAGFPCLAIVLDAAEPARDRLGHRTASADRSPPCPPPGPCPGPASPP